MLQPLVKLLWVAICQPKVFPLHVRGIWIIRIMPHSPPIPRYLKNKSLSYLRIPVIPTRLSANVLSVVSSLWERNWKLSNYKIIKECNEVWYSISLQRTFNIVQFRSFYYCLPRQDIIPTILSNRWDCVELQKTCVLHRRL